MDVIAYLIADALGRPLLHHEDTNQVGKRVDACARRNRGAGRDAEVYETLNLPSRTVGDKRKEREPPPLKEQHLAAAARVSAKWST